MKMFSVYLLIFLSVYNAPLIQGQNLNGDLRLSGFGNGGRLEVYLSSQGQWGTVCDDGFDFYEGDIACQQLGYLYADRVGNVQDISEYSTIYDSSLPTFLDDVACSTSATRIIDCTINFNENCMHDEDIVLQCTNTVSSVRLVSTDGRTDNLSSGRLEMFIDNEWGTVCDQFFSGTFTKTEADVACNQLGFPESNAYYRASQVGLSAASSSIPIWLSDITCTSHTPANNLRLCSHSGTGLTSSCSHSEDIILSCRGDGNLRLVVSSDSSSTALVPAGRLEIYLNGQWGTVCDDFFSGNDAHVACRQLGYAGYIRYNDVISLGYPSTTSNRIWLDDLSCTGSESALIQCGHAGIGVENCAHSEDIGLECSSSTSTTTTTTPFTFTFSTGGVSVGAIIGGIVTASFFGCGCCIFIIVVIVISSAAGTGGGGRHRRRGRGGYGGGLVVAPPRTTTVTTVTTPTSRATPQVAPNSYPVQGYSANPQIPPAAYPGNNPPGAYPNQQQTGAYPPKQGAYPPNIPEDSNLQEASPPSYVAATTTAAYTTHAPYPLNPQNPTPPAPYPGYPPQDPAVTPYPPQDQFPPPGSAPYPQAPAPQGYPAATVPYAGAYPSAPPL